MTTTTLVAGLIGSRRLRVRLRIGFFRALHTNHRAPTATFGPQRFGDSFRWPDGSWTTSG